MYFKTITTARILTKQKIKCSGIVGWLTGSGKIVSSWVLMSGLHTSKTNYNIRKTKCPCSAIMNANIHKAIYPFVMTVICCCR